MSGPPIEKTTPKGYPPDLTQPSVAPLGGTLLPAPIASLVSTFTQATSFGIRLGTKVGGFAIAGARETTLTSLELTRAAIEAVLTRAGRDVSERRSDELGKAEAESILERSISSLHYTVASVSFFASSAFYLSTAVLTSASALSIQGLSTLNAVVGSTESSRAVAAIIELIKDEFKKTGSGKEGEFVGYLDLFSGTVGFVLLQRWGRRKTEREFRENGGEEVIWDAVLDDKGFRADVVATKRTTYFDGVHSVGNEVLRRGRPVSFLSPAGDEAIEAIERGTVQESTDISSPISDQTGLSDEEIREHIMAQLPQGSHAVVASETITAKTIRVDLYNAKVIEVTPPPGTVLLREHVRHAEIRNATGEQHIPTQTIVFRTALRRTSSADIEPTGTLTLTPSNHAHPGTPYDSDDAVMMKDAFLQRGVNPSTPARPADHTGPSTPGSENEEELCRPVIQASRLATFPPMPLANQKKTRRPVLSTATGSEAAKPATVENPTNGPNKKTYSALSEKQKKVGPFRKALKTLSPSTSSTRVEDKVSAISSEPAGSSDGPKDPVSKIKGHTRIPHLMLPLQHSGNKSLPQLPVQHNEPNSVVRNSLSSQASRHAASQGYFAVREKRHDTMVHETETYSVNSFESRPGSPTVARSHSRTTSSLSRTRSDRDISVRNSAEAGVDEPTDSPHRRSRSFISSLYSMDTNGSETSLILAPKSFVPRASIFDDHEVLSALAADGKVPGIFPKNHLVRNIRRYARFSSASYGSQFLRFMGLTATGSNATVSAELEKANIHFEHTSFSKHTGLPPDTILLSSFEDPHGGVGYSGSPATALPLVHFISIDRESKAVILTCRGTLGFEDVLTDMLCDFDDLSWRGKSYKVHKGIHASARRMLGGRDSRVMATLKAALEEYPEFGLILTGHSLGGAVASLLAILISEPSTIEEAGALFVTTSPQKLIAHPNLAYDSMLPPITLPGGRPIHVYAYGPPATFSPSLRVATRGLITTIVNSNDIVPSLSLGILHDFRTVALNLKHDTTGAIAALKSRVWSRVRHAAQSAFYVDSGVPPPPENTAGDGLGEDSWAWAALKTLRAGMVSEKLVPPGEIFVVETMRVFDRQEWVGSSPLTNAGAGDPATEGVFKSLHRPATRVQLKLIRDVERRFGELRFGSRMFSDHSPARYEGSLAALETGILED